MPEAPHPGLPARPSLEHLKKAAKRLARAEGLSLARAQKRLAADHGFGSWAELKRQVSAAAPAPDAGLGAAAAAGGLAEVRRRLAEGAAPDGAPDQPPPLWQACASAAPDADRLAVARALLDAGASPRGDRAGETALHAAARRGPLALVELLIERGALEWAPDRNGRRPLASAEAGDAPEKAAIVELLDRPVIRDPQFRAAVGALQAGDAEALARLLDAHPRLLRERVREPDCYRRAGRHQYFLDPKLFWFVADNPNLVEPMPPGMVDAARVMIARGVDPADLDYTLGLVMTSAPAARAGLMAPLMALLLEAGAIADARSVEVALGHGQTEPVEALLAAGLPLTAPIAASLGRLEPLRALLPTASPAERQAAFGLAAINGQAEAARLCLEAGADVDARLPVHEHATALHNAAANDDVEMLKLLVVHGARRDIPDRLWNGLALDWAKHENRPAALAYLESLG